MVPSSMQRDRVSRTTRTGSRLRVYSGASAVCTRRTRNQVPATIVEMTMNRAERSKQDLPVTYNGFVFVRRWFRAGW